MRILPMARWTTAGLAALFGVLVGCASPAGPMATAEPAARATSPDLANLPRPDQAQPPEWAGKELPIRMIPNIPQSAEAYYAPDNLHVIAQTKDPMAAQPEKGKIGGSLTFTYTDTGEELTRINDKGQDACSWFLPDGKGLIWTSTRDNLDMPPGNWSEETDYPQGAELYTSDLKGGNIKRLTNNKYYEAEVTTSLDGKWVFFGRQIDGKLDIWKMRIDGTDEQQLTFTPDWQEGAPYPAPDGTHLIFRAWKKSDKLRINQARPSIYAGRNKSRRVCAAVVCLHFHVASPATTPRPLDHFPSTSTHQMLNKILHRNLYYMNHEGT